MTTSEGHAELRVAATIGAMSLPLFAAIENGHFAAEGLEVVLTVEPGNTTQYRRLAAGEADIVYSNFDGLVAANAAAAADQEDHDDPQMRAIMGGSLVNLSLVVAPDIEAYEDLRGRSLALDGLTSGYSFVLYEMLAHAGLGQADFKMVTVGAAAERWQALRDGVHAGTLTLEPHTSMARAAGYRVLDTSVDVVGPLQTRVSAVRRPWAEDNVGLVRRYIRGFLAGLEWTLAPANRAAAGVILTTNLPEIEPEVLDTVLTNLLAPESGLTPQAELSAEGMETVLALRERYGGYAAALGSSDGYLDLEIYRAVIASIS